MSPPRPRAKDPELVELGARVRELRERVGKSQETLAHFADDLHWTYLSQIERGCDALRSSLRSPVNHAVLGW